MFLAEYKIGLLKVIYAFLRIMEMKLGRNCNNK